MKISDSVKDTTKEALEQLKRIEGQDAVDKLLEEHGGMQGLYEYCQRMTSAFDNISNKLHNEEEEYIVQNYGDEEQRKMVEPFLTFDDVRKAFIAGKVTRGLSVDEDAPEEMKQVVSRMNAMKQLHELKGLIDDLPSF